MVHGSALFSSSSLADDERNNMHIPLLWQSNVTCEKLCYEVWLRLLELTLCLEGRQMPLARLDGLPWSFLQTIPGEGDGSGNPVAPEAIRAVLQGPECLCLNDRLAKRLATGSRHREKRRPKGRCEHGTNMNNQEENPQEDEDRRSLYKRRSIQRHSYDIRITRPATAPPKCASMSDRCANAGDLQCTDISNPTVKTKAAVADGSVATGATHPANTRVDAMTSSEDENSSKMDSLESAGDACPWLHRAGSLQETNKDNLEGCLFGPEDEEERCRGQWTHPKQITTQSGPFYLPKRDLDFSTGQLGVYFIIISSLSPITVPALEHMVNIIDVKTTHNQHESLNYNAWSWEFFKADEVKIRNHAPECMSDQKGENTSNRRPKMQNCSGNVSTQ
ncbi:unnamed protein product [Dibothriocephalus latus]|uniref:Uncharacterized protein n=1 Tax=Dibothriocephalus latus TaxID=60516 RepID=A0A3P6T891_DIBLA|nr:unnamed protein product [Dibothriocephalus latus]